jgi:GNAT superfamily N-acetyltransferase
VDEHLVPSCTLEIIPNLTRGCRPYGVIENVVTHEEHRRQGHARGVLNAALQDARSTRCYKAMLLTGRKDEGTLRLYESVGFDQLTKQALVARP